MQNITPTEETKRGRGRPKNPTTAEEPITPVENVNIPDITLSDNMFSDVIPKEVELPLGEEVKKKDYAQINIGDNPAPVAGAEKIPFDEAKTKIKDIPLSKEEETPKSQEEIQSQAEQTVAVFLNAYDKIHSVGRWIGKINEEELIDLHLKGKIDLDHQLPIGKKTIPVREFFADYNASIDENIVVTNEFKTAITPPLVRIATKRKWLLNDEYYVLALLSEDLIIKTSLLIGLKKSANLVLNACIEMKKSKEVKQEIKHNPPPPQNKKEPTPEHNNTMSIETVDEWREPEP